MTQNKQHTLWVERYRPVSLENYIGNEHLKTKVSRYISTGDIPHLLLHGKAGTGKTTLAKLLVSNIDSAPRGGRYLKKYLITFSTFLCSDTSISAIIKTNRVFSLQPFLIFVLVLVLS